ncbi:MAG: ribonuclease HI [Parcubacteria group bacterium Gr01-1014_3]|nr:MAG: ribonuclease HI [Parcubacteria group bacterium Gr01-1014_3]
MAKTKTKYYAYLVPGKNIAGVASNWKECEKIVKGTRGARYKGFDNKTDAAAWLSAGADYGPSKKSVKRKPAKLLPGIYFDAGTGRGEGVEISVTDEKGKNLLEHVMVDGEINKHGKHLIAKNVTNNYGELMACKFALKYAMKRRIKNIFGDSKLVVDYWSKGHIKNTVEQDTIDLAHDVAVLRSRFEEGGGVVGRISGDDNPADLGFHK